MKKIYMLVCTSLLLFSTASASALDLADDVQFLNLSLWNHHSIKTGQLFEDVYEDVDLTISGHGDFEIPSYVAGGTTLISSNQVIGQQTFEFAFSQPVPLVVRHMTTDDFEIIGVQADTTMEYTHLNGSKPLLRAISNGMEVQGTGRTISPDGAADGYFVLGHVEHLTLTHTSLARFKFEAFRIGVVTPTVPEPAGARWLLAGALAGLFLIRRR